MQWVSIKAEFTYDKAQELIKFLVSEGFSTVAKAKGKEWEIYGMKNEHFQINPNTANIEKL